MMNGANDMGNVAASGVIKRVAWRVNAGVYLTRSVRPVAGVIIGFGVAFLLSRMLAPDFTKFTYIILAGVPGALAWAWVMCRRSGAFFNEKEIVELVDHLSASDGLAATAYERPALGGDGGSLWKRVMSRLSLGPLRLNYGWFAWRLMPAMLFAGAVFLVPPRKPTEPDSTMMMAITEPLAERVKMAAEVLPEPEREKLEQQIEQVQAAPAGVSKEKWEAVEDLEQRLENALAQSAASTYQLSSSMNQIASMVSKQQSQAPDVDNAELQQDIDAMASQIMSQLANKNLNLSDEMKKQLQDAMGKCKGGKCKAGDLEELRKKCEGLSEKLAKAGNGQCYGSGGISRGRGDAPLVFGDERTLENGKSEAKQLENQYFEAADLADMGITTMEPKAEPGEYWPSAAKDYGSQQGTNVSRTEISPSQRGVVERYFK